MGLLESTFHISRYLKKESVVKHPLEFSRDPWIMDYIPELYVSSEKINEQVSRLIDCTQKGYAFCAILGGFKSGKSYLMNLLRDGLKESLQTMSSYEKIFVLFLNPENFQDYTITTYFQQISKQVLGKYYDTKEQIIIELKKFCEESNALIVLLLDNFTRHLLEQITSDTAKLLKTLKNNLSFIVSCNSNELTLCFDGLKKTNFNDFSYKIHIPEFSQTEAYKLIKKRLQFALNQKDLSETDYITERAIETAWVYSKGSPWILISILSDAFNLSQTKGIKRVTEVEIENVNEMFSRSPLTEEQEDNDKFIIQQALNQFPNRERQVCEYLLHRDASAKELTQYLYGDLPTMEYRSKYMGTKSFLKRLKEKNVVVIKGQSGRSFTFGLNPKMKEKFIQLIDKGYTEEEEEILAT